MEPLQLLLIATGLIVAVGGIVMLYRLSRNPDSAAPRPYAPFGMIAVSLLIAYRAYSDFQSLETIDVVIMFLFVFAMMSLLGLQFFVVDKGKEKDS